MKKSTKKKIRPLQEQHRPGLEKNMIPVPETDPIHYPKKGKLAGKKVLITGGDSGIGKAAALLFAKEGADISIVYLSETSDAKQTRSEVKAYGVECHIIKANLAKENQCKRSVENTIKYFKTIDILINNAALHWETDSLTEISTDQLVRTFENNVFSTFWVTKFALPYMKKGSNIINTASVTAKTHRLCGYKRSHHFFYPKFGGELNRQENPCECCGSRPDLDAFNCFFF